MKLSPDGKKWFDIDIKLIQLALRQGRILPAWIRLQAPPNAKGYSKTRVHTTDGEDVAELEWWPDQILGLYNEPYWEFREQYKKEHKKKRQALRQKRDRRIRRIQRFDKEFELRLYPLLDRVRSKDADHILDRLDELLRGVQGYAGGGASGDSFSKGEEEE